MRVGKLEPSNQCKNVERGTGKKSSMMSSVAAQPQAPDTLQHMCEIYIYSVASMSHNSEAKTNVRRSSRDLSVIPDLGQYTDIGVKVCNLRK